MGLTLTSLIPLIYSKSLKIARMTKMVSSSKTRTTMKTTKKAWEMLTLRLVVLLTRVILTMRKRSNEI